MGIATTQLIEGVFQIANVFLALVAGIIAISMFRSVHRKKELKAWKPLIISLVLFVAVEIFGSLRSFNIYSTPYLTHVTTSGILAFLIYALALQIDIVKTT